MRQLKNMARIAGLSDVRVQKSGCLDFCENGISCVVYPEGVWYTLSGAEEELESILHSHLKNGEPVEDLRMKLD